MTSLTEEDVLADIPRAGYDPLPATPYSQLTADEPDIAPNATSWRMATLPPAPPPIPAGYGASYDEGYAPATGSVAGVQPGTGAGFGTVLEDLARPQGALKGALADPSDALNAAQVGFADPSAYSFRQFGPIAALPDERYPAPFGASFQDYGNLAAEFTLDPLNLIPGAGRADDAARVAQRAAGAARPTLRRLATEDIGAIRAFRDEPTVTLYRGDVGDVENLSLTRGDHGARLGQGLYFTDDPDIATVHAINGGQLAGIPNLDRSGKPQTLEQAWGEFYEEIAEKLRRRAYEGGTGVDADEMARGAEILRQSTSREDELARWRAVAEKTWPRDSVVPMETSTGWQFTAKERAGRVQQIQMPRSAMESVIPSTQSLSPEQLRKFLAALPADARAGVLQLTGENLRPDYTQLLAAFTKHYGVFRGQPMLRRALGDAGITGISYPYGVGRAYTFWDEQAIQRLQRGERVRSPLMEGGAPLTPDDIKALVARKQAEGLTPQQAMADPEVQPALGQVFAPDYNAIPEGPATAADTTAWMRNARNAEARAAEAVPEGLPAQAAGQAANRESLRAALASRGVRGDRAENVLDMVDDVSDLGAQITPDGTIRVYHATNPEAAAGIRRTGTMTGKEDGLFFSTRPDREITGYGSEVVAVDIPIERLELNDVFPESEAHFRLPLRRAGERVQVKVAPAQAAPEAPADPFASFKPMQGGEALPEARPTPVSKDRRQQLLDAARRLASEEKGNITFGGTPRPPQASGGAPSLPGMPERAAVDIGAPYRPTPSQPKTPIGLGAGIDQIRARSADIPGQPSGFTAPRGKPVSNAELDKTLSVSPGGINNAREIIRRWQTGNRAILDRIGNDRELIASVRSAITGDVKNSWLTAALHRKAILRSALEADGVVEEAARETAERAFNAELRSRFGSTVPDDIKQMIADTRGARSYEEDAIGGFDTLLQRAKNTMFGLGDVGVFGVQVLNNIRRGGVPLLAGGINRTLAGLHLPHIATEVADTQLPKRVQYALDGLHQGITASGARPEVGTMLSYLGRPGQALDTKYVIPLTDKLTKVQFENVLGTFRNLDHEGNLVMLRALGRDIQNPRVRAQAASNANTLSSFAEQALTAGRRKFEGRALTSPSMSRARVRSIVDMAKLITPRASVEQRIMAASMIASTYAIYATVGQWLNDQIGIGEMELDPSKLGFGVIKSRFTNDEGKNIMIDIVPQDSVERAFALSLRALQDPEVTALDAQRAWERVILGSGSLATRGVTAGAFRTGFEPGKGYSYGQLSPQGIAQSVLPIPPIGQNLMEGSSALELGLGEFGISAYPASGPTRSGTGFGPPPSSGGGTRFGPPPGGGAGPSFGPPQ